MNKLTWACLLTAALVSAHPVSATEKNVNLSIINPVPMPAQIKRPKVATGKVSLPASGKMVVQTEGSTTIFRIPGHSPNWFWIVMKAKSATPCVGG